MILEVGGSLHQPGWCTSNMTRPYMSMLPSLIIILDLLIRNLKKIIPKWLIHVENRKSPSANPGHCKHHTHHSPLLLGLAGWLVGGCAPWASPQIHWDMVPSPLKASRVVSGLRFHVPIHPPKTSPMLPRSPTGTKSAPRGQLGLAR